VILSRIATDRGAGGNDLARIVSRARREHPAGRNGIAVAGQITFGSDVVFGTPNGEK
jgi:hypothetical protein